MHNNNKKTKNKKKGSKCERARGRNSHASHTNSRFSIQNLGEWSERLRCYLFVNTRKYVASHVHDVCTIHAHGKFYLPDKESRSPGAGDDFSCKTCNKQCISHSFIMHHYMVCSFGGTRCVLCARDTVHVPHLQRAIVNIFAFSHCLFVSFI